MKLRDGDAIADLNVVSGSDVDSKSYLLAITSKGFGKRVLTSEFRPKGRGGLGVVAIKFKSDGDKMNCLHVVNEDDEMLLITAKGIMVRQQVSKIPSQGRAATGVLVQRLDKGDAISSVSVVPKYEESDDEESDDA